MKTVILIAAWLVALIVSASAQTTVDAANKRVVASNNIKARLDTARSDDTGGTAVKEFFILYGGVIRIKWQMRSLDSSSEVTAVVTDPVSNGIPCFFQKTTSGTFVTKTCDAAVNAGETLQLNIGGGAGIEVRNFRIYFDILDVAKPVTVLVD
jgi:hypothetical protein